MTNDERQLSGLMLRLAGLRRRCGVRVLFPLTVCALVGCVSDKPSPPRPLSVRQAEAFESAALRHTQLSQWPQAAALWQQAVDRYALLNDQAREAVAWHNLASAQAHMGHHEEALHSLETAIALNESSSRWNEWWRDQIALVQLRSRLQQRQELAAIFEDLAPKASAVEDSETLGLFLNELGLWQWRQNDLNAARDTFKRALRQLQKAGSESGQAAVLANQALLSESAKDYAQATSLWQNARARFEKLGDPRGIAQALAGQGRSLLALGTSPKEAENLLRNAARNFQLLNMAEEQASIEELLKTPSGR